MREMEIQRKIRVNVSVLGELDECGLEEVREGFLKVGKFILLFGGMQEGVFQLQVVV